MPRPSNTKERRLQVTKAFMTLLARQGYDGTSISSIASEAGLTQGLIHYHFKNKEEILLSVLEYISKGHLKALEKRLSNLKDSIDILNMVIDFHLSLGDDADPVRSGSA